MSRKRQTRAAVSENREIYMQGLELKLTATTEENAALTSRLAKMTEGLERIKARLDAGSLDEWSVTSLANVAAETLAADKAGGGG